MRVPPVVPEKNKFISIALHGLFTGFLIGIVVGTCVTYFVLDHCGLIGRH